MVEKKEKLRFILAEMKIMAKWTLFKIKHEESRVVQNCVQLYTALQFNHQLVRWQGINVRDCLTFLVRRALTVNGFPTLKYKINDTNKIYLEKGVNGLYVER